MIDSRWAVWLLVLVLGAAGCGSEGTPIGLPQGLSHGDLLVTDVAIGGLFRIDPDTGERALVTNQLTGVPRQAAVDGDGTILVTFSSDLFPAVIRVTPQDGQLLIISTSGSDFDPQVPIVGSGRPLFNPYGMVREVTGQLVVSDRDAGAIVRVDPVTGDRTLVTGQARGTGPPVFGQIGPIALATDGTLLVPVTSVSDARWGAIFRVNPTTGDRTLISDETKGEGPTFRVVTGIAVDAEGMIYVADLTEARVVRVNPTTGDRTVVSGPTTGAGELLLAPKGLTFDAQERLLVVDGELVLHIDLDTGNRNVISAPSLHPGPPMIQGEGIVTVLLQ